jgi:hypothetical protein
VTVDELRQRLSGLPGDAQITFGQFVFNRVKQRRANLFDIELWPTVFWSTGSNEWVVLSDQPPEASS